MSGLYQSIYCDAAPLDGPSTVTVTSVATLPDNRVGVQFDTGVYVVLTWEAARSFAADLIIHSHDSILADSDGS